MAQLINQLKPSSYVDIGCAGGLLGTLTPKMKYIGVDFVRPEVTPAFEFHLCDLNSDKLPDVFANADLVTCSGILEYVDDLSGLLEELHVITRPEAKIIATYFNMNHVSRIWHILRGRTLHTHPYWRNLLSPGDLQSLMSKAGFRVERVIPVGFSLRGSPRVRDTVSQKVNIRKNYWCSYLLAHQFIFVLSK